MTRRLIVSADDLGLHPGINEGVLRAHEKGLVTAASIVACGRAFDHACGLLGPGKELDLGIHLTLIEEKPLLGPDRLRTLAPGGFFPPSYRQLFWGLVTGSIDLAEVEAELEAQIARVLEAGLAVSHLDSHQHAHFFPRLRQVFFALAERHRIPGLRAGARVVPARTKFGLLLAPLAVRLRRAARDRGLLSPDSLWLPARSGQVTVADLVRGIPRLPEGVTELVVHPGVDQKAIERDYPGWGFDWEQELSAITAPEVRDAMARHGVGLTRYSELG